MYQFVYDALDSNLDDYTTEELVTEVKDYYPELLEQDNDWSLKLTVTPKPFFSKLMQTSSNSINRDSLQEAYIESIIDGMDHKSMYQFVYDALDGNLDDYTTEELVTEVKDYYPELLEQDNDWSLN